jgi:hypothetical protein
MLRADRVLRVLVWIAFTYVVMLGGLRPFLFWSNREWFHGADNAWTALVAAQGVGALIGAVVSGLTSRWVARHTTAFAVTIWTGLLESTLHLTLLLAATPVQAMVLLALASIPETLCNVTWLTSAQERLSPQRQSVFFVFTAPVWDVGFAVGIFSAGLYAGGTLSLGQWWGLLVVAELAPMIQVVALYRGLLKRA